MWLTPLNGSWGHPAEGRETAFEAENEVSRFVGDEKLKVLLVQGGAGSGKSLFCHIFGKKMLEEKGREWIPVFINLSSLKEPLTQVIQETLKNNRFSEEEIN